MRPLVLAGCLILAPSSTLGGQSQGANELEGLWGGKLVMAPRLSGPITILRDSTHWTATIGGQTRQAPLAPRVTIHFGDSLGELRFSVTDRAPRTVFWVQPPGIGPGYATLILVRRTRPDEWHGTARPLPQTFNLFLQVDSGPDGQWRGVFRNPEANWNGRTQYRVVRQADTVRFVDPASGRVRWTQPFDPVGRRISFDFGAPLDLTPVSRQLAAGFYPRAGGAASYRYRMPTTTTDGWPTARASTVGLDEPGLAGIVRRIEATDPATSGSLRLHSLLVARRGRLVLDEYFYGYSEDQPHDLRSASKTITSVLAGVAIARGASWTMSSPALSAAGADRELVEADPRRARITIGQLLAHSSGLDCDDDDDQSPGNEDRMQNQKAERDWYRFTMSLASVAEPGERYRYCSAGINLVGGIIAKSLDTWLPELFHVRIARPLSFGRYAINLMPTGQAYAAGGMHVRPRDLLKIGQVYLDSGRWLGRRIIAASWVQESTEPRIQAPNGSFDGHGWHRYQIEVDGRTYSEYEASGNGGQFLVVVPELGLVVVATAGNYGEYPVWKRFRDRELPEVIRAIGGTPTR